MKTKQELQSEKMIHVLLLESEDLEALEQVFRQDSIPWRKINSFMYKIEDSRLRTSLQSLKEGAEGRRIKLSFVDAEK